MIENAKLGFFSLGQSALKMGFPNSARWISNREYKLAPETLEALFKNKIPAIRIPQFASKKECEGLAKAIKSNATFESYSYEEAAANVLKIGPAQCEYSVSKRDDYFNYADSAFEKWSRISKSSFSPIQRVIRLLKNASGEQTNIAQEKNAPYFAGVIRNISQGALLHMDYAKHDARGWDIEAIANQISWNLYVQAPLLGGEAMVHSKQWEWPDECYKMPRSYGYDRQVVWGSQSLKIPFQVGDLVLFNSQNYHEVGSSVGERLTVSSFVGQSDTGQLWLWS